MKLFEAFWGLFGDHFGNILGTFLGHFGGPERICKKMQENTFRGISPKSLFLNFWKKLGILGPEKRRKIGPKMVPKRVAKKVTSKSEIFTFFYEFYWIYCILQVIMGLQGRFYCVFKTRSLGNSLPHRKTPQKGNPPKSSPAAPGTV